MAGEVVSWAENAVCPSTDHDLLTRSFIISRQQLGRECCMLIHRSRPPYEILHNIKTASRPQHTRSTTNFCKAVPQRCFVLKNECLCCRLVSHVRLCATPCTVAQQAPVSAGIFQARILEWVAISSSRDLPNPGTEPASPVLHADSLLSESPGSFQLQRGHLKSFSNQNLLSHQELIKNMRVQQG